MKEQAFKITNRAFGAAHTATLMVAELIKETEVAIVKRTGYWEDGKQYALDPELEAKYREIRQNRSEHNLEQKMKFIKSRLA